MNTGNVVPVERCQQQPFHPHVHFHFIACPAVDAFLPSPSNKICVDSGRADTWETDPKAPKALEESLRLGFSAKLFAVDVRLRKAEGGETIRREGRAD